MAAKRARVRHQPNIDRGVAPALQREIQRQYGLGLAGVSKAVSNLLDIKRDADIDLLAGDYSRWNFVCLAYSGSLCFATSGAVTPNQDFYRTPLQTLHDIDAKIEHLYVSVVASESSPRVVFGWEKRYVAPARFVDSLLSLPTSHIQAYLLQFVFAHIENVYFSSNWWDALDSQGQEGIKELAGNSDAYYYPPSYGAKPTVPWSQLQVERFCDES